MKKKILSIMFALSLMNQSYAIVAPPNVANTEEIQRLVDSGKLGVHTRFEGGKTMLHLAVAGGNKDTVAFLLSKGADMNVKDAASLTPLHHAAQGGRLETARLLIESNADVNNKDAAGLTPLHHAAKGDHLELARLLIQKGANINAQDHNKNTPLVLAVGDMKMVRLLLEKGADLNINNPLKHAIEGGKREVAKLLLEKGARPYGGNPSALHSTAAKGYTEIVRLLIQKGTKVEPPGAAGTKTSLHLAAERGHTETVKLLLENGANPNKMIPYFGGTALHRAAREGKVELVALLLKHRTDPNIPTVRNFRTSEKSKELPIEQAVKNNQKETAKLLLKHGSDAKNALRLATAMDNIEMIKTLLENGADPNVGNKDTILQVLLYCGFRKEWWPSSPCNLSTSKKIEVIQLLLKHGLDINVKNNMGDTPLDEAIKFERPKEIINFLKSKGAKRSNLAIRITKSLDQITTPPEHLLGPSEYRKVRNRRNYRVRHY